MKIRSRTANILIARVATWILKLLFSTVKADLRCADPDATPYVEPKSTRRFAFCMWHDAVALAVFAHKTWSLAGLISQHRDGGYLADAAEYAGIYPVRGSASRGGAEAVGHLIERSDLHLAMTPDGPRGPRRTLKEGIMFLASRSRRPIVPTALTGTSCWSIQGNWTNLILPKPFSSILLIAGKPIDLPENLPREEFGLYTELLQQEMERLDLIAQRMVAGDESAAAEIDQRIAFPHELSPSTHTRTPASPNDSSTVAA